MAVKSDGLKHLVHTPGSFSLPANSGNMSVGIWHYAQTSVSNAIRSSLLTMSNAAVTNRLGGLFWDFEAPNEIYQHAWYFEEVAASPAYKYSSQPSLDSWHLYGLTLQGGLTSNNVEIYLDGVSDTPVNNDCDVRGGVIEGFQLMHDTFGDHVSPDPLAGMFVYDRILTAAEWAKLYAAGPPGIRPSAVHPSDLQVWWPGVDAATAEDQNQAVTGGSFTEAGLGDLSTAAEDHPVAASVTLDLVDLLGGSQASLTSLDWDFFDQSVPGSMVAPVDQGVIETTDANGQIVIPLPNTTLAAGATGFLALRDPANDLIGGYRVDVT